MAQGEVPGREIKKLYRQKQFFFDTAPAGISITDCINAMLFCPQQIKFTIADGIWKNRIRQNRLYSDVLRFRNMFEIFDIFLETKILSA